MDFFKLHKNDKKLFMQFNNLIFYNLKFYRKLLFVRFFACENCFSNTKKKFCVFYKKINNSMLKISPPVI